MRDESGAADFEFGVAIERADKSGNRTLTEKLTTDGAAAASNQEPDAEAEPKQSQSQLTSLEQLGAALFYYNTTELATLIDRATRDPDPPLTVDAILPWAQRLVDE